jgi:hypothetical protein
MMVTVFGIVFLIGATLSFRFRVQILLPAFALAVLAITGAGVADGYHAGEVILNLCLVACALQIGYLSGVVARAMTAQLSVLGRKAVAIEKPGLR